MYSDAQCPCSAQFVSDVRHIMRHRAFNGSIDLEPIFVPSAWTPLTTAATTLRCSPFRVLVCAALTLNAIILCQTLVTLSLRYDHLRAACSPRLEERGLNVAPQHDPFAGAGGRLY